MAGKRGFKWAAVIAFASVSNCSPATYKDLWSVTSPDQLHIATLSLSEAGTLGSSYFRLTLTKANGADSEVVFEGANADAEEPFWTRPAELIVPFCFGEIDSIKSLLTTDGKQPTFFRTRKSAKIRVHVITSPDTQVLGRSVCSSNAP